MEINTTRAKRKSVMNPEGSIVLEREPKIQLYLEASNLKIKGDLFYQTANEKLDSLITLIQEEKDTQYLVGLTKFLSDNGLKLSPVVLSVMLSNKGFSFRERGFEKVFNTPQRIAEAISLGKTYHLNNSFKQNVLRKALEGFNDYTLKKNKMESRKVKLKDLIKLLRPRPRDEHYAKLYKDIIESGRMSRLKKEESLIAMKSSNATDEQKIEYYDDNIGKIPINQLIRNLKFIADKCRFRQQNDLLNKVINRLSSITDYRFLNVFDLIEASISVPQLEKALFEVINDFVKKIKAKNKLEFVNATVLFDLSGSMDGVGLRSGFKYLVLLSLLYDKLHTRFFSEELICSNKVDFDEIIKEIRYGNLTKAFSSLCTIGGTALIRSTIQLLEEQPAISTLIVISDEVSWTEGNDLTSQIYELNDYLAGKKLVLINPVVYKGTTFAKNVVGIASLTSSIIIDLSLFDNAKGFVEFIKNYEVTE